jgi:hypothetical protein
MGISLVVREEKSQELKIAPVEIYTRKNTILEADRYEF